MAVAAVVLVVVLVAVLARSGVVRSCKGRADIGASRTTVRVYRAIVGLSFVLCAVFAGLGTKQLVTLHNRVNTIDSIVDQVRYNTVELADSVAKGTERTLGHPELRYTNGGSGEIIIDATEDARQQVASWADDMGDKDDMVNGFLNGVPAVLWVPVGCVFALGCAVVANLHGSTPTAIFALCVLATLAAAAFQGISAVAGELIADTCSDSPAVFSSLSAFFNTSYHYSPTIQTYTTLQHAAEEVYYRQQCINPESSLASLCAAYFDCSMPCETYGDIEAYINTTIIRPIHDAGDCGENCTIPECAVSCPSSHYKQLAQTVLTLQGYMLSDMPDVVRHAEVLASARIYSDGTHDMEAPLCRDQSVHSAVNGTQALLAVVAVLSLCVSLLAVLGTYIYTPVYNPEEREAFLYANTEYQTQGTAPLVNSKVEPEDETDSDGYD